MQEDLRLNILFRIPFTIYFLAIAEERCYETFKKKKYLCLAVKEFLDYEKKTNYYFSEISRHKHISRS